MSRLLKLSVTVLGLLTLSCAAVKKGAEDLAGVRRGPSECDKLNTLPSLEEEYALGGAVALNWVQRGGGLLPVDETHEPLLRYLNTVGRNLGAQSPRPGLQWTFGVLQNEQSFDALSAPGGYVFVTLGLLEGVENEAQLAGVLAHEIAHITSKHALTRYNQVKVEQCKVARGETLTGALISKVGKLSQAATQGLLGGLKSAGGALDLDHNVDLLGSLTEGVVDTVVSKGFGKEDEFAADEQAVRLLVSAGYDPREYIEFLAKIPDSRSGFANHPRKVDRVKRLVALLDTHKDAGDDFPELAASTEGLVQPPLPPEFVSAMSAVARDKP
jgi:predicted Zn-dependent protease